MAEVSALRRQYDTLSTVDSTKDEIIKRLFAEYQNLERRVKDINDEVDNQKVLITTFKEKSKEYKAELNIMQHNKDALSYASVLVDGDGMNFIPELVQGGEAGGAEAAQRLTEAVKAHLREVDAKGSPNITCRILVYANVNGLTVAYHDAEILRSRQDLRQFIQGFNKDGLADFIDVGGGKECADAKLHALFRREINNVHCRWIVFCGSADNSHARLLGGYEKSNEKWQRVSLVEGPPFAAEVRQVAKNFQTTKFENVFMSKKLETNKKSPERMSPPLIGPNYAAALKVPATVTPPDAGLAPTPALKSGSGIPDALKPHLRVLLNENDERVDTPLRPSKDNVSALKSSKLCNAFYILGKCPGTPENPCEHNHKRRLSGSDLVDLLSLSRSRPCHAGLWCVDPQCLFGHRCLYGDRCTWGAACNFPDYMHGVDVNVVSKV
ncbi:CCCH zinc finger DNA binding protein [Aspergillus lucknowensis]|uniref:C-x8-C-x5-C-x3-H type zinc finger protein n=1 Tax=Aspergillus lucknowensis TaxID=176173 RepID=A0ABR4M4X7_9EURO